MTDVFARYRASILCGFLGLGLASVICLAFDHELSLLVERIPQSPWLAEFKQLTWLGEAKYYLLLSFIGAVSLRVFGLRFVRLSNYLAFCFFTLSLSGLIVDLIKMLVGRSRPYVSAQFESLVFAPFSFNHSFQSFPSGHSQTAFTLALLVGLPLPKLRLPAFIFALAIAATRVLRNVHFLSDVVAGMAVACVGLLIAHAWFPKLIPWTNLWSKDFNS